MIWRLILEKRITIHDPPLLYMEDILDMNEALDVWCDMNDLDKTTPAKVHAHSSDGVITMPRGSAIGRLLG